MFLRALLWQLWTGNLSDLRPFKETCLHISQCYLWTELSLVCVQQVWLMKGQTWIDPEGQEGGPACGHWSVLCVCHNCKPNPSLQSLTFPQHHSLFPSPYQLTSLSLIYNKQALLCCISGVSWWYRVFSLCCCKYFTHSIFNSIRFKENQYHNNG